MLVLALVSLEIPLALSLRARVNAEVRGQARSQADVVAATASELLAPAARPQLRGLVATSARSVRGRVIAVDSRGALLADSAGVSRVGDDYGNRPEIAAALRGHPFQSTRHSETLRVQILATAVPILRHGRPAGAVRITQSVEAVRRAVRDTIVGLALIAAVVLVLGLVAGALIAGGIARPISRLDLAVRRVAEGHLEARAPVEGSREQRSLARTFNEMAERLSRLLRSQQDFVADASHQLRTPLTGMRLRIEELQQKVGSGAGAGDLDAVVREIDRLAAIVEELLVLTRAGERELPGSVVDLADAAHRAVERWTALARERAIRLQAADDAAGAGVWCAASDLDRALDALIENAIHYSPSGSTVTVAARPAGLEVLDEGPGLEPGEEERVFERFHRGRAGREAPSGTGLGLPIARELAREWGGTVTLANRPQGGVRAAFSLPRHPG